MSFAEWVVVAIVAIIVFGPKKLPEMARKIGKILGMLRRASEEFQRQLMTMDQVLDQPVAPTHNPDDLSPASPQSIDAASEPPLPFGPEVYDPYYQAQQAATEESESATATGSGDVAAGDGHSAHEALANDAAMNAPAPQGPAPGDTLATPAPAVAPTAHVVPKEAKPDA